MDNDLWFNTEMNISMWTRYIYQLLKSNTDVEVTYKEYSNYISIWCKYFTFSVDKEELIGADMVEEVFGFSGNVQMSVQMFNNCYEEGMRQLINLLRLVLEERKEDFLLLENGDVVVLKRKENHLYTEISREYSRQYFLEVLGRPVVYISE